MSCWPRSSIARSRLVVLRTVEVDEPVLADLDLVTAGEQDLVDPVPVDVGAVEAADIGDEIPVRRTTEDGVPSADGHVVEEDLTVGVTARGHLVGVEQE